MPDLVSYITPQVDPSSDAMDKLAKTPAAIIHRYLTTGRPGEGTFQPQTLARLYLPAKVQTGILFVCSDRVRPAAVCTTRYGRSD